MLLRSLYVKEDFREKGVAKALLRFTIKKHKAKRVYAAVQDDKVDFYIKQGFEEIKTFPKDFSNSLKEVASRGSVNLLAFNPGKNKDESFNTKPNLIVIDGGKGQLNKALEAMAHYGLEIPMIGLAKREEDVYMPGQSLPLLLPKDSPEIRLLQRVRDEAHRFAITHQRSKRKAHITQSALDDLPGLGVKNKMKLLRHFGSVAHLLSSNDEEIEKVVGPKLTQVIREHLNAPKNS